FVAEAIEQGLKRMDVIGSRRNVGALVAAEALMQLGVVIPERARMDLHHQPVLEAHVRHLGQHLPAKCFGFRGRGLTFECLRKQRFAFRVTEIRSLRGWMAVVGRRRAHGLEECAPVAMCGKIAAPSQAVFAGELPELFHVGGKTLEFGIDRRIRAVRGDHATFQALPRGFAWCASGSSGDSVVAMTSMLKRSNNARGRNSGLARQSLIRSKMRSADSGVRRSRTPNTSWNAWSSQTRVGVP